MTPLDKPLDKPPETPPAAKSPFPATFEALLRGRRTDKSALFPFYDLVPKDPDGNAGFREWIARCGDKGGVDREFILEACAKDLLFFINTFLWIKQENPVPADLPFITWPRQDEYVALMCETRRAVQADTTGVVRGDTLAEKCREVGWSWLTLAEGLQIVRFTRGATGLIGSRVETDVDGAGGTEGGISKTLFYKLDYYLERLPQWFMPEKYWGKSGWPVASKAYRTTKPIKLVVPGFGTMLGSATHENFGRSGRFAWMLLDEFAHTDRGQVGMGDKIWSSTTKTCRVRRVVSTPNGRANKFASLRFSNSLPVFTVQWFDDPAKMIGSYELTEELTVGPVTLPKGAKWSPWAEATRKADDNDPLFAQEVLLSYEGLGGSFYDAILPTVQYEQVKDPVWVGNVRLPAIGAPRLEGLEPAPRGYLRLWEACDSSGSDGKFLWPKAKYLMGIDVASGSRDAEGRGASNSVISVGRLQGKKVVKVAQYMTHGLLPHLFARIACAIGYCFCWPESGRTGVSPPAYAIWERNGPGDLMGDILVREYGYPNAYWSQTERGSRLGFQMQTFRLADGTLAGSKVNVFNNHKHWLSEGWYEEPSFETFKEMEQYRYTEDGGAEHHRRRSSLDPSEARDNHGDSVIATVLMLWLAKDLQERDVKGTIEAKGEKFSVDWAQRRVKRAASGVWR